MRLVSVTPGGEEMRPQRGVLVARAALACIALIGAGCASLEPLPPALYQSETPFEALAPELRTTDADVLFVTDRAPETDASGALTYGTGRSRSMAFGSARVSLAPGQSWDDLVAWTRSQSGAEGVPQPVLREVTELGRFPDTPLEREILADGTAIDSPRALAAREHAAERLRGEIRRRLALATHRTVAVFVHGVQNTFAETVTNNAIMWHQGGRQRVIVTYSWPAGGGSGPLTRYSYDRESGEFTIYHLKALLRLLAAIPEVDGIILGGHSRGTDIAITALRELTIEARASGRDPREVLRIEHLILAAPDLDIEVASQRFSAERLNEAVGAVTAYTSSRDSAIGAARSLFASELRAGRLAPEDLGEQRRRVIAAKGNFTIIFYEGSAGGRFGHSYYRAPAVSSDIALLLAGRAPGAEHGRPLEPLGDSLWSIGDDYLR